MVIILIIITTNDPFFFYKQIEIDRYVERIILLNTNYHISLSIFTLIVNIFQRKEREYGKSH